MRLAIHLITCSMLFGCAIPRPVGWICLIDEPHKELHCFDMKNDYDSNGNLKPGTPVKVRPLNDQVLDKGTFFDSASWSSVSVYIQKVKAQLQRCESKP